MGPVEQAFKLGEAFSLPCLAEGNPKPMYSWLRNGLPLHIRGLDISQVPGEGTITIQEPNSAHEGVYQCQASNAHGTALSVMSVVRKAVLEPFPTIKEPKLWSVPIGSPLTLTCQPPISYPTGAIYWGENRNGSKLRPIETDNRVSLDYSGNLHFANVAKNDSEGRLGYVCIVSNKELRSLVQGDDQKIESFSKQATPRYDPPKLMWSSPTADVAIATQTKKMKCIFSGYPTPTVTWTRLDAAMPSKNKLESFGQELVIESVDFSDRGRYQCSASNNEPHTVTRDFSLTVESSPFWRNNPPEDVSTSEEEDAVFECHVNGVPKPETTWFINGLPLQDYIQKKDPRIIFQSNILTFKNVTKTDAKVIQCNASNAHGYIFANAFLNVFAEAPSFIEEPQKRLRVAEGQTAVLRCRVHGAPKPELHWQKGNETFDVLDLTDDRYSVLDTGDMEIKEVRRTDEDVYQCYVHNKFGSIKSTATISVSDKTVILERPRDQTVLTNHSVSFNCSATTDVTEQSRLKITWSREGVLLNSTPPRVNIQDGGRVLTFQRSEVNDTGRYTCRVDNGIDEDSVTVTLTVKDRPSPPRDLKVTCGSVYADLSWVPGSDNNDHLTSYILHYNTTHTEPGRFVSEPNIDPTRPTARVKLLPWSAYTFHVTAVNSLGESERSLMTSRECRTPPARPEHNPYQVCTRSRTPDQLVIIWEPMIRQKHNGDGFHYVVRYRRVIDDDDDEGINEEEKEKVVQVWDWHQSELVVSGQPMYKKYEVSVQANNSVGAPLEPLNKKLGYSGEDKPVVSPQNFAIRMETLNSTSAEFSWRGVDPTMENIRGFFRGYQIQFSRESDPDNIRVEDLIINEWQPCKALSPSPQRAKSDRGRRLVRAAPTLVTLSTNQLWPYTTITAGVVVLNGANSGPISNVVTFMTPEGVPSEVLNFKATERGSHHLKLSWTPPTDFNGHFLGYTIGYKLAPPEIDTLSEFIVNGSLTHIKIRGLISDINYMVFIAGFTSVGSGPKNVILEKTAEELLPDIPSIESVVSGNDSVNITWLPSGGMQQPKAPGSDFVVEYRLHSAAEWLETPVEDHNNWRNITGLVYDWTYEFRVRAMNGKGDRMHSESVMETIGIKPEAEPVIQQATSALWFIILICILLLLVFLVVIILLLRRNRGENYPVYEKERLHGNKGTLDEEASFREYFRQEEPTIRKSQGSLESSGKSEEDEGSDSLGVYEDNDPNKFNDEGSFVEQTATAPGYRKLQESKSSPTTDLNSPPSALSTFV